MSQSTLHDLLAKRTQLNNVPAFAVHNFQRKQKKERKGSFGAPIQQFAQSYATNGHDRAQGIVIGRLPTDADRIECLADRDAFLAMLDASPTTSFAVRPIETGQGIEHTAKKMGVDTASATYAELATFLRKPQFAAPDGKLYTWRDFPLQVIGMVLYRRNYASPACVYAYSLLHDGNVYTVDCDIVAAPSEFDEMLLRIEENRQEGREAYSFSDSLAHFIEYRRKGFSESECIIEEWGSSRFSEKRGAGMKAYPMARLHILHPSLDILDRVQLDEPTRTKAQIAAKEFPYSKTGHIYTSPMKPADLNRLIKYSPPSEKAVGPDLAGMAWAQATFIGDDGKPIVGRKPDVGEQAPANVVEQYFALVAGHKVKTTAKLSDSVITAIAEDNATTVVGKLASAILKGDREAIGTLSTQATCIVMLDKPVGLTGKLLADFMVQLNQLHDRYLALLGKVDEQPSTQTASEQPSTQTASEQPSTQTASEQPSTQKRGQGKRQLAAYAKTDKNK